MRITSKRLQRFEKVARQSQLNLTVILENVHDPHNIGAVLRTCDSVGIREVFVILTDKNIDPEKYEIGHKSSSSAKKWIDIRVYTSVEVAIQEVRKKYDAIVGTALNESSVSLYATDLSGSVALAFGNERDGLSSEMLPHLNQNIVIPQFGMIQSLNISVACAITLYESCRQRLGKNLYADEGLNVEKKALLDSFIDLHNKSYKT